MATPLPPLGEARVSELLHAFLAAEYRWQHEGGWHDIIIGLPTPGLELAYPEATSFGLLSAWNPLSVERSSEENRRADEALHQALVAGGHPFRPAFASARNRTWREPSWLVMGMEPDDFDALSRRFGQLGTLWWRPCEPVRLRMAAARPSDEAGDTDVDWLE
ncbi:DUF3293 domain-containing protein [Luteimonas viscosa]|uniref:DUF3293 domain-containing protein n=1 Tax=Luteimonas viscosa TaxID=1132694 RepID=A0A5D4XLK7_9GAMM|nr:DUF3293 domain-containing protein [Luteimonas viscosa]TYT24823.1 DUF3293 domain-containing protein [Luteimonas viscosa]